jgi:bleomycin hydrolase
MSTFAEVAKIASAAKPITTPFLTKVRTSFASNPALKVSQNALVRDDIKKLAVNHEVILDTDASFSTQLDTWACTNQKSSGRCWLFALLNLFRPTTALKLNVKEFEFSQAHICFWDKFERANHFLTAILETSGRDADDRTVNYLLG